MHQPDGRREGGTMERRMGRRRLARPAVGVIIALLVWLGAAGTAHAQIAINGVINEPEWHLLGTSEGGPAQQDPFVAQDALNALYANIDADHFYISVAGNVEPGNRILVFIDSRVGGFADATFGREQAPPGINSFRRDIRFDEGFTPDYVLVIGAQEAIPRTYQWDLYRLSLSGGPNVSLTNRANVGADPHISDRTRGFEARFAYAATENDADLVIDQPYIGLMAVYIRDDGYLSNQFIARANPDEANYRDRQVFFDLVPPGPVTFAHFFVINELDYIQPGPDDAEFIELKNITHLDLPLAGFSLALARNGDTPYLEIPLPPYDVVPADGYYVICADPYHVPNCDLDVYPQIGRRYDLLENTGPAAVALRYNGAVVDAVSYDGVMPFPYNENSSAAPADPGEAPALSLSRYPDGLDTNRNSHDFSLRCITPGRENTAQAEDCYYDPPPPTTSPTYIPPTYIPPTRTPGPPGTVVPPPMNGCRDILVNGDFENNAAWRFGNSPVPGKYTSVERRSGRRSVQLGNPDGGSPHVESYSSVRQEVMIPKFATTVQLRWWHFYGSDQPPADHVSNQHNRQEVIALTPGGQTIQVLQRVRRNDNGWHESVLDLSEFAGKSFVLYVNVYNTGKGGRTWMYLDDVMLWVCGPEGQHPPYPDKGHPPKHKPPHPTPMPTATPTPTMSPTPTETPTETPQTTIPTIVLNPDEGPAGEIVNVSGMGFPANSQVNILLARYETGGVGAEAGGRYASTFTDSEGQFEVSFEMPAIWPEGDAIMAGPLFVVAATNDLAAQARAIFEFQAPDPDPPDPSILLIPFEGGPGTRVIVEGTGFPANEQVDILLAPFGIGGAVLDDWDFQIASTTNDEGNFMVRFDMPAMWDDGMDILDGTLMVMAITADQAYRARALFEFMTEPGPPDPPMPAIVLAPIQGTVGTNVVVTGTNFSPNVPVTVYLATLASGGGPAADTGARYDRVTTDAEGEFVADFDMPDEWSDGTPIPSGSLLVVAATDGFAEYANAQFRYTAPVAPALEPELAPSALSPAPCIEVANNGDFEQVGAGWNLSEGDIMPMYVTDNTFNDSAYAARLGLIDEPNQPGMSAIDQVIQLPAQADSILLSFRYYPLYEEPAGPGDLQYVDIYNAQTGQFAGRALGDQLNDRMWLARNYDLTALAGQSVRLVFAVNNDGVDGRIAMYVDRVSVLACNILESEPENGEQDSQSSRQIFQNPARPQAASLQPTGSDGLGESGWQLGGALIVLALTGVFGLVAPAIRRAMRGRDG